MHVDAAASHLLQYNFYRRRRGGGGGGGGDADGIFAGSPARRLLNNMQTNGCGLTQIPSIKEENLDNSAVL